MLTYIFEGSKIDFDKTSGLTWPDQGTVHSPGDLPVIWPGEEIKLSAADHDRLSQYFFFTKVTKDGEKPDDEEAVKALREARDEEAAIAAAASSAEGNIPTDPAASKDAGSSSSSK